MLQLARPSASSLDMLKDLDDLDRGVVNHTRWLKQIHRTLICEGELPADNDIRADAHCHCAFGRWYYNGEHQELEKIPLFNEIGLKHEVMHDLARKVLLVRSTGNSVCSTDYNAFIETAIDFKVAIRSLQNLIIDQLCVIDHLTGCYNRQAMAAKLAQEYDRVSRKGSSCALAMIDLDHFKQVNDTYGHAVGDEVLRGVAERLGSQLRSYDTLFRYGGEEFLACLPDSDGHNAQQLMERLRCDLAEHPLKVNGGTRLTVTASVGVSYLTPSKSLDETLYEADHALLNAKSSGRNQVRLWDNA